MIRLARVWYNFVAEIHDERAKHHARRRDKALRKLERIERRHHRRQVQAEIAAMLARKGLRLEPANELAEPSSPPRPLRVVKTLALHEDVH